MNNVSGNGHKAPVPTANDEAEQELQGTLLLHNNLYDDVAGIVRPEHFAHPAHGRIYAAIAGAVARGEAADALTLRPHFENDITLAHVGGARYLQELTVAAVAAPGALAAYATAVADAAVGRAASSEITSALAALAHLPVGMSAIDVVGDLVGRQEMAMETGSGPKPVPVAEAVREALAQAEAAMRGETQGISTGLPRLDAKLGGLREGELVIIAGRPSMGKTALAGAIALNVARAQVGVGFLSLEMAGYQIAQRWLSIGTGIAYSQIHRGAVDDEQFQRLHAHGDALSALPIWLHDMQGETKRLETIGANVRRLKRQHGVGPVVVDYLGLIEPPSRYRGNRVAEIGEITAALKSLASSAGVCIVLLSQLSRDLEKRDDKRPQLHDLRESGAIEQDADAVLLLYREEYYLERARPKAGAALGDWQAKLDAVRGLTEVLVAKNRNGPIGTARLHFDATTAAFKDYDQPGSDPGTMELI